MYMLQSYPAYAASLFAANDACRSVLAAGAVHLGVPFYATLGVEWGCTILAAVSVLGIFGMWALYWKGPSLRARSKFAVA
jgi:DHA1 family multidrug resistance protein-like MFS transporter